MDTNWKKDYLRYRELFVNLTRLYNTKPTLKVYLELMLTITTVMIFALFAIKPTILTILELNKEIKGKEVTISKLQQKVNNLNRANSLLQSEAQNLELIDQAIPDTAAPERFLKQVEILTGQNSIQLVSFNVSNVNLLGENKSDELPFNLSVSGNYQSITNFLINLENLRRPYKLETFSLGTNMTESGKVLVLSVAGKLPFLYDEEK